MPRIDPVRAALFPGVTPFLPRTGLLAFVECSDAPHEFGVCQVTAVPLGIDGVFQSYKEIPIPKYDDEPKPLTSEDILAIRKSTGLSRVKFAAALGVSVKKVSAWEHGKAVPDEAETEKIRKLRS